MNVFIVMTIDIFSIDFYLKSKIFGLYLFGIMNKDTNRHLFSIYFWEELESIDLFWFRIYTR